MGFKRNSITFKVFGYMAELPYFSIDNLSSLNIKRSSLKVLLHRLMKKGEIISLKKGLYVSRRYIDGLQKKGVYTKYVEFIGGVLLKPSYLSLEYVLAENNLLTELSWGFTFVTRNKTSRFINEIGNFTYRHISEKLFCGFKTSKAADLIIYKATPAKALFDFLYLRKRFLTDPKGIRELRLNTDSLKKADIKEFRRYVAMEESDSMKTVSNILLGDSE